MQNRERRYYGAELRAIGDNDKCIIEGYAALFESDSENLGGFVERIAPGAFNDTDFGNCKALFNHDNNFVMASEKAGTLTLEVDDRGLKYSFEVPASGVFYDQVYLPIQRGDIDQSSFAFMLDWEEKSDHWENVDGTVVRTILKIDSVYDVSPVTYPAYQDTSVLARNLEKAKELKSNEPKNNWEPEVLELEAYLLGL